MISSPLSWISRHTSGFVFILFAFPTEGPLGHSLGFLVRSPTPHTHSFFSLILNFLNLVNIFQRHAYIHTLIPAIPSSRYCGNAQTRTHVAFRLCVHSLAVCLTCYTSISNLIVMTLLDERVGHRWMFGESGPSDACSERVGSYTMRRLLSACTLPHRRNN